MQMRTVKVSNISKATSERDIEEFFSFSGEILYVEMQRLMILFYVLIYLKKKKKKKKKKKSMLKNLILFVEKLKILRLLMLHTRILKEQILQSF